MIEIKKPRIECSETAVLRIERVETAAESRPNELCRKAAEELEEYFSGKRRVFDLPLQTIGTEFQQRVWQALRGIPWGEVRTYAQVAEQIGCPGGARAVGNACGKNPVLIVTPCHRVLGGKDLGGFRCGPQIKRALLRLEGYGTA